MTKLLLTIREKSIRVNTYVLDCEENEIPGENATQSDWDGFFRVSDAELCDGDNDPYLEEEVISVDEIINPDTDNEDTKTIFQQRVSDNAH